MNGNTNLLAHSLYRDFDFKIVHFLNVTCTSLFQVVLSYITYWLRCLCRKRRFGYGNSRRIRRFRCNFSIRGQFGYNKIDVWFMVLQRSFPNSILSLRKSINVVKLRNGYFVFFDEMFNNNCEV